MSDKEFPACIALKIKVFFKKVSLCVWNLTTSVWWHNHISLDSSGQKYTLDSASHVNDLS